MAEKNDKFFTFAKGSLETELSILAEKGIRQVFVTDESIIGNKGSLIHFIEKALEKAPDIFYEFELSPDLIDRETVEALAEIYSSLDIIVPDNFWTNSGGAQKLLSKKSALLNNAGLIFGFSADVKNVSVKSFRLSLDFLLKQYPNHISFNITNLKPSAVLSTQDIAQLKRLCFATETFYTAGRAVPWFLTITDALRINPSVFLGDFAEWQHCNNCDEASGFSTEKTPHAEIEKMQLSFTKMKFEEKRLPQVFPAAEDCIKLNGAFARATAEGTETIVDLSYSPKDIFSPYVQNLVMFADEVCMEACSVRVFSTEDGPDIQELTF